jgi:hypothetical protein
VLPSTKYYCDIIWNLTLYKSFSCGGFHSREKEEVVGEKSEKEPRLTYTFQPFAQEFTDSILSV